MEISSIAVGNVKPSIVQVIDHEGIGELPERPVVDVGDDERPPALQQPVATCQQMLLLFEAPQVVQNIVQQNRITRFDLKQIDVAMNEAHVRELATSPNGSRVPARVELDADHFASRRSDGKVVRADTVPTADVDNFPGGRNEAQDLLVGEDRPAVMEEQTTELPLRIQLTQLGIDRSRGAVIDPRPRFTIYWLLAFQLALRGASR